jgi:DNA adenine methylase
MQQLLAFEHAGSSGVRPFRTQFLKWIGNKQRFAHEIAGCFPSKYGTYIEPFLGSAAVLGTLAPSKAIGSDVCRPLVELWQALRHAPDLVKHWYAERWKPLQLGEKQVHYERVKASFNDNPNPGDLLFLCRSCYEGVVRFRKADGYMSTPCGVHGPISPESLSRRVDEWSKRCRNADFIHADYREIMSQARRKDLIYCDPPYVDSQAILYGAQAFSLANLLETIAECKRRGVFVALSIDGTKRSGDKICDVPVPDGLFEQEVLVNCGRSMLRRFQMAGQTLEGEVVADRLLLTYRIEDRT